jgi:CHAD domain-containing protein
MMSSPDEPERRREVYVVPTGYALPELSGEVGVGAVRQTTDAVETTHYDTGAGHLRSAGVALTRTKGGDTPVWTLDLSELGEEEPVVSDSKATTVPRELSALLTAARGSERLASQARVQVARDRYDLVAEDGTSLGSVVDERTTTTLVGADRPTREWRTITLETTPTATSARKALRRSLRDADARPVASAVAFDPAVADTPPAARPRRLARLIDRYLLTQFAALTRADLRLRLGDNAVHDARVAIRRIRSVVHAFSDAFDADRAAELDAELLWYSSLLGRVRDADVVRPLVEADLASLPEDLATGANRTRVNGALATERESAAAALESAMSGRRYAKLVTIVAGWQADPPYLAAEEQPRRNARRYLAKATRKLERRLEAASRCHADPTTIHRARKAAKRLRHAVELAAPVLTEEDIKQGRRARRTQRRLGDYQDARVARDLIVRLGSIRDPHEPGLVFGYLAATEHARSQDLQRSFRRSLR